MQKLCTCCLIDDYSMLNKLEVVQVVVNDGFNYPLFFTIKEFEEFKKYETLDYDVKPLENLYYLVEIVESGEAYCLNSSSDLEFIIEEYKNYDPIYSKYEIWEAPDFSWIIKHFQNV